MPPPAYSASLIPPTGLFVLFLLVLAGCGPSAPEDSDVGGSQFGDPYDIVLNRIHAEPDLPPHLSGDTLVALIPYPGGCEDHVFELDYAIREDTARLRVRHDARGDQCEALIQDELRLVVPAEVLQAGTVLLQNPNDSIPFVVPQTTR